MDIQKQLRKITWILLILFTCTNLLAQDELEAARSLKLIFEPVQEVSASQIGNTETDGVLGSLPSGIDIKVKAEIEVADTANLAKVFIKLGTQAGAGNLFVTTVDIQQAITSVDESFFINEHYIVIYLGSFPKPEFISCDVYLKSVDNLKSPVINYQTR